MSRIVLIAAALTTLAMPLWAQPSNGYLFFAPGGVSCCGHTAMTLHAGVGGEWVIGKGVGAGAEVGAVGIRESYGDSVVGVLSPNGYYHFVHGRDVKVDPFVTGGYTLMFRYGTANLFNFGAGLNYWVKHSLGFRMEFRDHVTTPGTAVHYWGVRLGLVF